VAVCGQCGEENPDRARFCLACGRPLAETDAGRQTRTVTLLFSDIVGSTALGTRLDPEVLAHVTGDYYAAMKPVVEERGGTVVKFIGDALVVVWGLDGERDDDALRACRAALTMADRMPAFNAELERKRGVQIGMRSGIATGPVTVAGSRVVTGDTSNVASGVQGAAEPGETLLDDATYARVHETARAEPVGPVEVKGKTEPLHAYRLLTLGEPAVGAGADKLEAPGEL
jgi:class 3 adenylate cyclase